MYRTNIGALRMQNEWHKTHNSACIAGTRLTGGNFSSSNWINSEQLHEIDAADEEDSLIRILKKKYFFCAQGYKIQGWKTNFQMLTKIELNCSTEHMTKIPDLLIMSMKQNLLALSVKSRIWVRKTVISHFSQASTILKFMHNFKIRGSGSCKFYDIFMEIEIVIYSYVCVRGNGISYSYRLFLEIS